MICVLIGIIAAVRHNVTGTPTSVLFLFPQVSVVWHFFKEVIAMKMFPEVFLPSLEADDLFN